jgi:hypothetical protein
MLIFRGEVVLMMRLSFGELVKTSSLVSDERIERELCPKTGIVTEEHKPDTSLARAILQPSRS